MPRVANSPINSSYPMVCSRRSRAAGLIVFVIENDQRDWRVRVRVRVRADGYSLVARDASLCVPACRDARGANRPARRQVPDRDPAPTHWPFGTSGPTSAARPVGLGRLRVAFGDRGCGLNGRCDRKRLGFAACIDREVWEGNFNVLAVETSFDVAED